MQDDRADRNARIERCGNGRTGRARTSSRRHRKRGLWRQRVADGPRVGPATMAFELRDDLHCANLRRAGDGAGGEAGAEQVEGREALLQLSGDLGDQMGDVREPLRLEEALDVDGPGHADARKVVAAEVDEHYVLG